MERTQAYLAGVAAGRDAEKSGDVVDNIKAPRHYTDAQLRDFVKGFVQGIRWQRDDEIIFELCAMGMPYDAPR